jgi:hypothetical protein
MDWHKVTSIRIDKEKIERLFREEGLTVMQLKERFNTTALMIRTIIKKADVPVCYDKKGKE